MAECEILEGDGRRTGEEGTQEGPHTDHRVSSGLPRHQAWRLKPRLYPDQWTEVMRQVQPRSSRWSF